MTSDAAKLAAYADDLVAGIRADLPLWVETCVASRSSMDLSAAASAAGTEAASLVGDQIQALLERDIADQHSTPLTLLRGGVRFPTAVLADAGVAPVARDEFSRRKFPDDPYDLTPASFADISARVAEAGLLWGAAKAHVHLTRRREASQP